MNSYELIEHTADIGIRVKGRDLKDLFETAASAMFDIMAKKQKVRPAGEEKITIKQKGDNLEELFINWLNELLSLSATKELIFEDFNIYKLEGNNLEATVTGGDIKNYKLDTEIKAATYHKLELKKTESGWEAEVIFDV